MSDDILIEGSICEATRDRTKQEVVIDLIREGFGNKRDGHYYSSDLLKREADKFSGAKMYVNHVDPETEKRLNGLPRPVEHLGGRLTETKYLAPGSKPEDRGEDDDGYGINETDKGVLRGKSRIAQPWLWQMIESDPELLGVSIHAGGKSNAGQVDGRQAKIVEAIQNVRSVDFVTEAGAGGKVFALVEAQIESEEDPLPKTETEPVETPAPANPESPAGVPGAPTPAEEPVGEPPAPEPPVEEPGPVLEGDLEQILDVLEPVDALEGAVAGYDLQHDDGEDALDPELVEAWARLRALALEDPAAARVLIEAHEDEDDPDDDEQLEEEDEPDMTDDEQIEARAVELAEEKVEGIIADAKATFDEILAERDTAHERAVEVLEAEFNRKLAQKDQRILAAQIIEGAGFKAPTTAALKEEFHDAYFEADTDADGAIIKSAEDKLREAVTERLKSKRAELQSYVESRVSGAGETDTSLQEAGGSTPGGRAKRAPLDSQIDAELGIEQPEKAAPAS